MFIQQVDNKIADIADMTSGQKIRYTMSLLKGTVAKWTTTYMNKKENIQFNIYKKF